MGLIKVRFTKKTKKDHVCLNCKEVIKAGDRAYYLAGKDSEGFYSKHSHTMCFLNYLAEKNIRISPELMMPEEA